jgi:hypothetical protein
LCYFLTSRKKKIASQGASGGSPFELKSPYDTSSSETNHNPEAALMADPHAVEFGDTRHDLNDMQRLGKKQEFKVSTSHQLEFPHSENFRNWMRNG